MTGTRRLPWARPWRPLPTSVGFVLAATVGLALRVFYILTVTSRQPRTGDAYFFYYWPAIQLAKGHGFLSSDTMYADPSVIYAVRSHVGPVIDMFGASLANRTFPTLLPGAAHPPGFITFLAGLDVVGISSFRSMMLAVAVLGAVTIVLIGKLVAELAGRRAGLIAAFTAAIYPGLWLADVVLMSETLMVFGLVLGLYACYRYRSNPSVGRIVMAATGFTIAGSARPESVVLLPVVLIPLVFGTHRGAWKTSVRHLLCAAVLPILIFGGWWLYNLNRFEHPVLLSTGFGQTAAAGACNSVFTGPMAGYFSYGCLATFPDPPISQRYPYPLPGLDGHVDDSVRNAFYTHQVARFLSAHRAQIPFAASARVGRLLGLYKPGQTNKLDHLYNGRGSLALVRVTQWSFWGLAISGIIGAIVLRRRGTLLYPITAEIVVTIVVTAITFATTRYRIGLDVCALILAAVAWDALWRRATRSASPTDPPVGDDDPAIGADRRETSVTLAGLPDTDGQ